MHILDLSVVLVRSEVFFLGIHELTEPSESLDLNWVYFFDDVPIDILGARWLRNTSFIHPSLFVIDCVEGLSNLEERGNFIIMVFKLELSEEVLESLIGDRVDFFEFFNAEQDCGGSVLNIIMCFIIRLLSIVVHLQLEIEVVSIDCVLRRSFQNKVSWLESFGFSTE